MTSFDLKQDRVTFILRLSFDCLDSGFIIHWTFHSPFHSFCSFTQSLTLPCCSNVFLVKRKYTFTPEACFFNAHFTCAQPGIRALLEFVLPLLLPLSSLKEDSRGRWANNVPFCDDAPTSCYSSDRLQGAVWSLTCTSHSELRVNDALKSSIFFKKLLLFFRNLYFSHNLALFSSECE